MDKAKLVQLLKGSQVPNTEQVKAATAELQKDFYSKPESLLLLIEIALTNEAQDVRQLAYVQALRLVPKYWGEKTAQDQRQLARTHLLDGLLKETANNLRHSACRLIAGIVGVDIKNKEGEEFLKQLLTLSNNDNVGIREAGSYLLYAMLENNPMHFLDHIHDLLKLCGSRLEDPESKDVRVNIVRAIGVIAPLVEPEEDPQATQLLQGFLPGLVNILKATIQDEDSEGYNTVFEVFETFVAHDPNLLGQHLKDLLDLVLEIAANTEVDEEARTQAINFLVMSVGYRRMKIQAMKDMGSQLMIKAMHIIGEIETDDDEELTPARSAIRLVDTLANELPPRQVIVPLLEQFPIFAAHQKPQFRMAAMLALGNAAEGAPDFISTQLKPLLPLIVSLLSDAETQVRYASLIGLIHLSEEMVDEMVSHHEELINAVLKNLQAASEGPSDKMNINIIRSACTALDTLGDGVDTKIMAQYGPNLVGPMVRLLDHSDFGVKSSAASALGAIAAAMEKDFLPYFNDVMEALGKFVVAKENDEALELRSSTCDSMGRIALAVGPEAFQPYVMKLMEASEEALGIDNPRLKETSFILWSNLAKVYKEDFNHFLKGALEGLFNSLELEEEEIDLSGLDTSGLVDGSIVVGGKQIKVKASSDDQEDEMAEGDDDWDDLEDLEGLGAVTAVALEQEIALDVLGDIISHSCGTNDLETVVEKTIEKVLPFTGHSYEGCRKTAISTLWRIYARVFQVWEEGSGSKWEPGMPPKQTPPPSIISIAQTILIPTLKAWPDEHERAVVTDINRNVAATLKACGPSILVAKDGALQEIISVVGTIVTRSHQCQQDFGFEDEEPEVDAGSSEYDWLVTDTALDVVVGLAAALGPDFHEIWKIFEKPVLKLASSTEDIQRSTAVGTIAEIVKYIGEAVTPYTESLGEALARRLTDTDPLAKSNAAYAIGMLVLNSNDTAKTFPLYPRIWEKLEPLLAVKEQRMADNVSGALSRMMIKHPDNGFIAEALPSIISVLPLEEDYEENVPIFQNIYQLYDQSNQTVQQFTPQLLTIFEKVLSPPEEQLEDDAREMVKRTVQGLYKTQPSLFANHQSLLSLAGAQ
ncbi:unnamed protein product [Clonostachys rhizophaga]|uniref:Importin N-terminal domain-containing protein n=1 Tax=Clonostachys rhizophaga TaxID=160324 RepID=A0A9N9YDJ0_9HYPO|nr:unnamed protein product [Clonostachys rhizophaga]